MKLIIGILLVLYAAAPAQAQYLYYPGSVWSSNGTLSPVEKGNVISITHAEQGVAYRGAELFFETTVMADTKAYDWNRRVANGVGLRFTQVVKGGMVRAGTAYVWERRYTYPYERTMEGLTLFVDTWFGWGAQQKGGR